MPVLQIMSDVHVEFFRDDSKRFFDSLDPTGADILVLAGDIDVGPYIDPTLRAFCARWPRVVFVSGNHEYYNSSPVAVRSVMSRLVKEVPNLTWLDSKPVVVDGVRFIGGTLWFSKPVNVPETTRIAMNDFHTIREFEPWVYDENLRCEAVLRAKAKDAHVVVTHHLPTMRAIAPQYAGNPLNHFFCHDLTDLIESAQPPLWIFGHTHAAADFKIGETRLVCNPKGYPHEKKPFNDRLLIEVKT